MPRSRLVYVSKDRKKRIIERLSENAREIVHAVQVYRPSKLTRDFVWSDQEIISSEEAKDLIDELAKEAIINMTCCIKREEDE